MYQMRAEDDPEATDQSALVWHVMEKNATGATICGRILADQAWSGLSPESTTAPRERYCSPCLAAFARTMETRRAPAGAGDDLTFPS